MGYFDPTDYTIIDPPGGDEIPDEIIAEEVNKYMESHPVKVESLDGFSARLLQAEYNPSDYLVVDDGEVAKKISVDEFVEGAKENIYGEKNYFLVPNYSASRQGVAVSSDEKGLFTINGTARNDDYITFDFDIPNGTYKVKPFGNPNIQPNYLQWFLRKRDRQTNSLTFITAINAQNENNYVFSVNDTEQYKYAITITMVSGKTYENEQIYPYIYMVSDADGSATNKGLTDRVTTLENKTTLPMPLTDADINTQKSPSTFSVDNVGSSAPNIPTKNGYYVMSFMQQHNSGAYEGQIAFGVNSSNLYLRNKLANTWGSWKRLITEDDLADVWKAQGEYIPTTANGSTYKNVAEIGQTNVTFNASGFMSKYNVANTDLALDIKAETQSGDVVEYNNVTANASGVVTIGFDTLTEQATFICRCSAI